MKKALVYRPAGTATVLMLAVIAGMILFGGTAYSVPPQGAAPVNIADPVVPGRLAGVTADSKLRVAGDVTLSGTPNVNVVNTPQVEVTNFPATQNVNVTGGTVGVANAPTTASYGVAFDVPAGPFGDVQVLPLGAPITASLLTVFGVGTDELAICLQSQGSDVFCISDSGSSLAALVAIPLTQPIITDSIRVHCHNESDDCEGVVYLVGQ